MAQKAGWRERLPGHGNIFTPHAGSMTIHVHRESGVAHRMVTLKTWQVRALRFLMSKWFFVAVGVGALSWSFFAFQAARVPVLTVRVAQLELDARRLDTLQRALLQLQSRYDQIRGMLSAPTPGEDKTTSSPELNNAPAGKRP